MLGLLQIEDQIAFYLTVPEATRIKRSLEFFIKRINDVSFNFPADIRLGNFKIQHTVL